MRLCRFSLDDEVPLSGFYLDEGVVPIDQAVAMFEEENDRHLGVLDTGDIFALLPPDGESRAALLELSKWVVGLGAIDRAELSLPFGEVHLLPPIPTPGKILMLARNYPEHSVEQGDIAAEREETFPYIFLKPPSAFSGPGDPIVIPSVSPKQIDWECELGVVIGRTCRHVTEAEALDYVAGYTVVNDISDRGFKPNPGRKTRERDAFFDWLHGKWHDSFCPVGPCLLSSDAVPDPQDLSLKLTVNGHLHQESSTSQMIFPVAAIIAFASSLMTLEPGDLIATGTPSGVGKAKGLFLNPGDQVVAEILEIGKLRNPVVGEE